MQNLPELLSEKVSAAFAGAGYDAKYGKVAE